MLTPIATKPEVLRSLSSRLYTALEAGLEQGECVEPRMATRTALRDALSETGVQTSEHVTTIVPEIKPRNRRSIIGNLLATALKWNMTERRPLLHVAGWEAQLAEDRALDAIYRAELVRRREVLRSLAATASKNGLTVTNYALDYGDAAKDEAGLKGYQPEALSDHKSLELSLNALAPLCR